MFMVRVWFVNAAPAPCVPFPLSVTTKEVATAAQRVGGRFLQPRAAEQQLLLEFRGENCRETFLGGPGFLEFLLAAFLGVLYVLVRKGPRFISHPAAARTRLDLALGLT